MDCSLFFEAVQPTASPVTNTHIAAYVSHNLRYIPFSDNLLDLLDGFILSSIGGLQAKADILAALSRSLGRCATDLAQALLDEKWSDHWLSLMYESNNIALKRYAFLVCAALVRHCSQEQAESFIRVRTLIELLKLNTEGMVRVHVGILGLLTELVDRHGSLVDVILDRDFRDLLLDFMSDNQPFVIRDPALKMLCQCYLKASHSVLRMVSPILSVDFFLEMVLAFGERHQKLILQCLGRLINVCEMVPGEYDLTHIFMAFQAGEVLSSLVERGGPGVSSLAADLMKKVQVTSVNCL
jgi:hypothetical protein